MDCYAPPPCYSHCACCAHRPTSKHRPRALYFVPVLVEDDDYETHPLYLQPYQYFPQVMQPRRSRTWSRRAEEEEEEEEEEMLKAPLKFFYSEENPRKKKIDVRKNSQEEYLQSLAHRLEALELGLQRLATVQKAPRPQKQQKRRVGGERVAGSSPPADGFPRTKDPPRSEAAREKISKTKSFVMNPEEAAVIIQSRFRAYLVRRSETLRQLRDLAMVKSTLKELHCLYADSRYRRLLCRDPDERNLFSERATALLLKVDSIQECDSMVREARRALSEELVTLLDSLDGMRAKLGARTLAQARVDKEDIMMRDRVMMPGDCIECSGEEPIPAEDEEEMEGWTDWRAPSRYFPRPVCNSNRGRHSHVPRHCKSSDFDASANAKTRMPFKCRKKLGSPGHLLRDEMIGIDDMDEVGFGSYCSSAALPF